MIHSIVEQSNGAKIGSKRKSVMTGSALGSYKRSGCFWPSHVWKVFSIHLTVSNRRPGGKETPPACWGSSFSKKQTSRPRRMSNRAFGLREREIYKMDRIVLIEKWMNLSLWLVKTWGGGESREQKGNDFWDWETLTLVYKHKQRLKFDCQQRPVCNPPPHHHWNLIFSVMWPCSAYTHHQTNTHIHHHHQTNTQPYRLWKTAASTDCWLQLLLLDCLQQSCWTSVGMA